MSLSLDIGLACNECGKPLGRVDQDEFNAIISGRFGKTLCFECDEFENVALVVRTQFSDYGVQPRAHERTRARGLSSVTYLNTGQKVDQLLSSGVVVRKCQECCGGGVVFRDGQLVPHDVCDGLGIVESALYLPKWLLGLGCEHA